MTKIEFLNSAIEMMKKTGQGIPGNLLRPHIGNSIVDELISEGKLVSTWSRFKTLPDDEWLTVSNCYNVWTDTEPAALEFTRMYLGVEASDLKGCSTRDILINTELMERYSKWLNKNKVELEKMVNLEPVKEVFIDPKTITFSKEEVEWVKERGWYKDNLDVKTCLKKSLEYVKGNDEEEMISLNKRLLQLYKSDPIKYKDKIIESEKEISDVPKFKATRLKLNQWLEVQDKNNKIQDVFLFQETVVS